VRRNLMPIVLYERESGARIAEISRDELEELQDSMEEEFEEDTDYYIDPDTIDYLAAQGVSVSLLEQLRGAIGEREGIDIVWRLEP